MTKSKRSGPADLPAQKLVTQKDGRKYALRVLARLEQAGKFDNTSACPFDPAGELGSRMNPMEYYRTGPQWGGFADDVFRLFQTGSVEAQKGFLSIITDCFAGNVNMDLGFYRDLERKGHLQNFGERGDAMPLPVDCGTWAEVDRLTGWKPSEREEA